MITFRELFGKFLTVGQARRCKNFLVGSVLSADSDIFHDRVVEKSYILKNDRIQRQQNLRFDFRDIHPSDGNRSPVDIPESRRQTRHRSLSAAGRAYQSGDLPLFRRKRDVFQNGFSGVVGKTHVIEGDITAPVCHLSAARLYRVLENFIHTTDVRLGRNHCGEILQRALQRRVQPRRHKQKQKEQRDIDFSPDQQYRTRQSDRSDSELQYQRG